MTIRKIAAAVVFAGFFAAGYGQTAHAETAANTSQPATQAVSATNVTVAHGDTLSRIASAHQTSYVRLYDANANIEHPDVIHPGEVLRVPAAGEQLASRPLPAEVAAAQSAAAAPAPVRESRVQAYAPPVRQQPAAAAGNVAGGVWDRLAQCESGGNWAINTGNGFYGGLQFTLSSWQAVGGTGYPHQASKSEQIMRAEKLLAKQGWGAWPACTKKLGLR